MPSSKDRGNITSEHPIEKFHFVVPYHVQKQYKSINDQGEDAQETLRRPNAITWSRHKP